jgi:arsenite methyltransferase
VLRPGGRLAVTDLYARSPDGVPMLQALPPGSCLGGAVGREAVGAALRRHGFAVRRWEDHSRVLTALAVRLLWEHDDASRLWYPPDADPAAVRAAVRAARPGYFLLIAEMSGR